MELLRDYKLQKSSFRRVHLRILCGTDLPFILSTAGIAWFIASSNECVVNKQLDREIERMFLSFKDVFYSKCIFSRGLPAQ